MTAKSSFCSRNAKFSIDLSTFAAGVAPQFMILLLSISLTGLAGKDVIFSGI